MNANVENLFPGREEIYDSVADLVPGPDNPTPMVRVGERFNPKKDFELLVKLEGMNPFGSIKDRTAWYMLKELRLRDDQSLVEPSAGNTGIALAMVCAVRGYPFVSVMAESFSIERRRLMRFLGARVVLTPAAERATCDRRAGGAQRGAQTAALPLVTLPPDPTIQAAIAEFAAADTPAQRTVAMDQLRAHYASTPSCLLRQLAYYASRSRSTRAPKPK